MNIYSNKNLNNDKKNNKNLPVKAKSTELITVNQEKISPLDITQKLHHLKSRADVRKYLPDILEGASENG